MPRSTAPPTGSATIGPRRLGQALSSAIGPRPGATGSEPTATGAGKKERPAPILPPIDRAAVAAQLAAATVQQNDRALAALLRRRFGFSLACAMTLIYPDSTGTYCCRALVSLDLAPGPDADPTGALAAIDRALTPPPAETIVAELTRLRLRTKARRETTDDMAAAFALFADDLAGFPADVVHETLDAWPRRAGGMWWPSWRELDVVLRAKAGFRQAAHAFVVRLVMDSDVQPLNCSIFSQETAP